MKQLGLVVIHTRPYGKKHQHLWTQKRAFVLFFALRVLAIVGIERTDALLIPPPSHSHLPPSLPPFSLFFSPSFYCWKCPPLFSFSKQNGKMKLCWYYKCLYVSVFGISKFLLGHVCYAGVVTALLMTVNEDLFSGVARVPCRYFGRCLSPGGSKMAAVDWSVRAINPSKIESALSFSFSFSFCWRGLTCRAMNERVHSNIFYSKHVIDAFPYFSISSGIDNSWGNRPRWRCWS